MANNETLDAFKITEEWVDAYSLSGISVGAQLLVSCRGHHSIYLAESTTQPDPTFAGVELYPTRQLIVDAGSVGLWARTPRAGVESYLTVQEDI